jgi:uncharacterized protein YecE (DUF72 family)
MSTDRGGVVRLGCSGWNYKHWRDGVFYPPRLPPRRWLEFYAQVFDTVEVNSTFYRLPRREAVANWVALSPPDFLFAVKMSRYVTHIKRLTEVPESIAIFYERIEPLVRSPKLGPVLWQLPGTFRRDDERLAATLAALPSGRHCFEFRHESWFVPEVYELLRAHGAALVIGDDPRRPFQTRELTADWTFVRFHAGSRGERGNYAHDELEEWAGQVEEWRERADVYLYFNNDWEGFAIENGRWLKERLGL